MAAQLRSITNQSAHTLAQITGIAKCEIESLFQTPVHVSIDPGLRGNKTYELAFAFAVNLISKTFPNLTYDKLPQHSSNIGRTRSSSAAEPSVVLRFGNGKTPNCRRIINANCQKWKVFVDCPDLVVPDPLEAWNPVLGLVTACYAAARVASCIFAYRVTAPEMLNAFSILDFRNGTIDFDWQAPLDLDVIHFAGIGAVGTAALFAMAVHGAAIGKLILIDHDVVDSDNIERYCLFDDADLGKFKVDVARKRIGGLLPSLDINLKIDRLQEFVNAEYAADPYFRIARLISCPDRRDTRREFQALLPAEVWDASTGPDDLIIHHNEFDPQKACLGCIYPPDPSEDAHFRHVAEVLNVSFERVRSAELITESDAEKIRKRYTNLTIGELVNRPFDTVFRQLCAAAQIRLKDGDESVIVPFPFVSALAGVLLYFEVVRTIRSDVFAQYGNHNYVRLNPFFNPNPSLKTIRGVLDSCPICQNVTIQEAFAEIWNRLDI